MKTIEEVKRRAESEAKSRGYFLTPDKNLLQDLLLGLLENEMRAYARRFLVFPAIG